MIRKVCIVTGSRAEFGLLSGLMEELKECASVDTQLIVTGMHLSPEYGLTYREIEKLGYKINSKVEMLLSADSASAIAKSVGLGMIGFADALANLQPDILVVLGDRYEVFAAVAAALIACIPVAHLHGGEITEGAFDDSIRHSITKMSHLHFVAAEEYRRRVIQLGESPDRVFLVGGLGADSVMRTKILKKASLEVEIDFKFQSKNLLITYHPVTLDKQDPTEPMGELLKSLNKLVDVGLIFTMPNADPKGRKLIGMINDFVSDHPAARVYKSLGRLRYLSCMKYVDGVVGNSSSGLLEAPSLRVGTINIGDRQKGRIKPKSVIDCESTTESIDLALQKLFSPGFRREIANVISPYGSGGASQKIACILSGASLDGIVKKTFFNI